MSNYFEGYVDKQFLFLIISLDPWGVLRSFRIPDELIIETNMRGFKRRVGEIEVLLLGDKFSGLKEIADFEFLISSQSLSFLLTRDNEPFPFGYLRITLGEESTAIVENDPLGIHPIYYGFSGSDLILSVRRYWLDSITNKVFEVQNGSRLELSYKSIDVKNIEFKNGWRDYSPRNEISKLVLSLLDNHEKKIRYIFRGSPFDEISLEILQRESLIEQIEFFPINKNAKEKLTSYVKQLNLDPRELEINTKKMEGECKDENNCVRALLAWLKSESIKEGSYEENILLIHLLDALQQREFSNSDTTIIDFVRKKGLYKDFRNIFTEAWPLGVVDHFFPSKNMLVKGKDLISKLGKK